MVAFAPPFSFDRLRARASGFARRMLVRLAAFLDQPQRKYLAALVGLACLLLIVFTIAVYQQSVLTERSNLAVIRSYDTLQRLGSIATRLMNAETGQRGFLLSGSRSFLDPYSSALNALDDEMQALRKDADGNPPEGLPVLQQRVDYILNLLATQVTRVQKNPRATVTLDDLKDAKIAMDLVRTQIDTMTTQEKHLLAERLQNLRHRQQSYLFVLFAGMVLALGALGLAGYAILVLTSRGRQAAEALRKSEELFALVMQGVNDGIYDFNVAENAIYYSPSYKSMLGYSDHEHPDKLETFDSLLHPEDRANVWQTFELYTARKIPAYNQVFRLCHKDGSWRWVMARGTGVWDESGKFLRMVGALTDITAQKEYEEDLKQLNADLEGFTHIASHDMRAPLVNLKGFSDEVNEALTQITPLMRQAAPHLPQDDRAKLERVLERELPEALTFIQRAIDKMDKLTDALLDLSRIGRRTYRMESIDTRALAQQCLDTLAYEIGAKKVDVNLANLPTVTSDPLALEQIFSNILDNAVKYLDPDRPGKIWVQYKLLPREIIFSVTDNGRGIEPRDRRKVFDLFRRASNTGDIRGAGVGMAYVKATVRSLNGRIWFDSMPGIGTTFYVSLPRAAANQTPENDPCTKTEAA